MPHALKTSQVLERLALKSADALYALVRSGRLPAARLGRQYRFHPEAVEQFLRGETAEVVPRVPNRTKPDWLAGVKRTIRR